MSLSQFTMIEIDDTLKSIHDALTRHIADTSYIQVNIAYSTKDTVELVAFIMKYHITCQISARKSWVLLAGEVLTDVYLEQVCSEVERRWWFNCGEMENLSQATEDLHQHIQRQDAFISFMDEEGVLDVVTSFLGKESSDEAAHHLAGYLEYHHPAIYSILDDLPCNYGELQEKLYGRVTGSPF